MENLKNYFYNRIDTNNKDMYIELLEILLETVTADLADEWYNNPEDMDEKVTEIIEMKIQMMSDNYLNKMMNLIEDEKMKNIECDGNA